MKILEVLYRFLVRHHCLHQYLYNWQRLNTDGVPFLSWLSKMNPSCIIVGAFSWNYTPEHYYYWQKINTLWEEFYYKYYFIK